MVGYIYLIVNKINNKKYVGQSFNPSKRWQEHLKDVRCGGGYALHRAMRKHGVENFQFSILEGPMDEILLDERETFWINELHSYGEYNMTFGGDHPTWCDEAKIRLSESIKKSWEKSGEKERRSLIMKQSYTEELRERRSKKAKELWGAGIMAKRKIMYKKGKIHTEESKALMGASHKENWKDPIFILKMELRPPRQWKCLETLEYFSSASAVAKLHKVPESRFKNDDQVINYNEFTYVVVSKQEYKEFRSKELGIEGAV